MFNKLLSLLFRANALFPSLDRSQAIIEFRPDGTILRANKNFLSVMEYTLDEIRGQHHRMFLNAADSDGAPYEQFWQSLRDGNFKSNEFCRVTKSGREVWIQATYMPVLGWFGNVRRVVKIASDITEQKLKSLRDAGKINAIDHSQAVIEFKMDGTIIHANENFLTAMGGYTLDEIVGQHHRIFVDPDEAESAEYSDFWKSLRNGQFRQDEFRRFDKQGQEVWIQAIYNPVFDPLGRPVSVVKFATDVTEQVQAREEMAVISLVANKTDNSVVITDPECRIEYANSGFQRLTGYSPEEVIGKNPRDLLQGELTDPETIQRIRQKLDGHEPFYEEILNYTKSGEPYWISLAINPVFDSAGKLVRFISIQTDISETKLTALTFDKRLQAIGSINAIVEWNDSGKMVDHNQRLSELAPDQRIEARLDQILTASEIEAVHNDDVVRREICWPGQRKEALWFDCVFAATRDIHGHVERIVMFGADVSSRRQVVDTAMLSLDGVVSSSAQITKIVKSLDQIASQTNMLSLNAAVEAAHAGEAGAGFSVVSKEIGSLAARSTREAQDIAKLAMRSQEQVESLAVTLRQLSQDGDTELATKAA